MVSSAALIEVIVEKLRFYQASNIVVDPVMVSTSGSRLFDETAIEVMTKKLFPLATVVTPNISEAEVLSGMVIRNQEDMMQAAKKISCSYHCTVLCKGGHSADRADDLLYKENGTFRWFEGKRIDNPNTHGTGCTFSSAIASNLAKGYDLETSVKKAKDYVSGALAAMLDLGHGSGPMNHAYLLTELSRRI